MYDRTSVTSISSLKLSRNLWLPNALVGAYKTVIVIANWTQPSSNPCRNLGERPCRATCFKLAALWLTWSLLLLPC